MGGVDCHGKDLHECKGKTHIKGCSQGGGWVPWPWILGLKRSYPTLPN
jgi:hypothetical protein